VVVSASPPPKLSPILARSRVPSPARHVLRCDGQYTLDIGAILLYARNATHLHRTQLASRAMGRMSSHADLTYSTSEGRGGLCPLEWLIRTEVLLP
jgi:hypothetical protein